MIRDIGYFANSGSQLLGHMVYFPLFLIVSKSVYDPMYLAGSEGFEPST